MLGVLVKEPFISSIAFLKLLNATITIVTLSKLHQCKAFFIMHSAPNPRDSCTSGFSISLIVFHTQLTQSSSCNLSKIPSQPRRTKSWESSILKDHISGFAITTWFVPCFASKSPNVQQTESQPGKTQIGPMMISGGAGLPWSSTPVAIVAV